MIFIFNSIIYQFYYSFIIEGKMMDQQKGGYQELIRKVRAILIFYASRTLRDFSKKWREFI